MLLIEDGVYAAIKGTAVSQSGAGGLEERVKIYVLKPDLEARGMPTG